jgi:hypothetical protein
MANQTDLQQIAEKARLRPQIFGWLVVGWFAAQSYKRAISDLQCCSDCQNWSELHLLRPDAREVHF